MSIAKGWRQWEEGEKAKLLEMAKSGKYTLDQITAEFPGRSRDAVQGVISRGRKNEKGNNITVPGKRKPVGSEKGMYSPNSN